MKSLLVIFLVLLISLFSVATSAEDCLVISEKDFTMKRSVYTGLAAQWKATVTNQCGKSIDAALTIHFENTDGESLYETFTWTTFHAHEIQQLGKQVYLPSRLESHIDQLSIVSKESSPLR